MKADVLLGLQWGDEGKGKIVDVLTPRYPVIARFQGGPNAGHTLEFQGIKHVLHTIPSGIFHDTINIVGNGVVIDPIVFRKEIEALEKIGVDVRKKLLISRKAHLILPSHRLLDAASEQQKGKEKIGSTLRGIGPAYMDKTGRNGLRVGDIEDKQRFREKYDFLAAKHRSMLEGYNATTEISDDEWFDAVETLRSFTLIDSETYVNQCLKEEKAILAEGAQGSLLDIDFGTYPFVTSSSTISAGACTGLGIPPNSIGKVFGIFKAYCTRVGSGPFPTELLDETGAALGKAGNEFGSTTGRPRRCGWLDLPSLRYAIMINGVSELMMMKADVLSGFKTIKICTHYEYDGKKMDNLPYSVDPDKVTPIYTELQGWDEDLRGINSYDQLPENFKKYVQYIEEAMSTPITLVSVGPDRSETILRDFAMA